MINKEKAVYIGIGVFFLLVLLNSSKKVQLTEVSESGNKVNFDSSKLPFGLKPPSKWDESKPLPNTNPKKHNNNKNLSLDGLMPRFDL
jgi:hypothetical protein